MSLLEVENLSVRIGKVAPVDGVSFSSAAGETFARAALPSCFT